MWKYTQTKIKQTHAHTQTNIKTEKCYFWSSRIALIPVTANLLLILSDANLNNTYDYALLLGNKTPFMLKLAINVAQGTLYNFDVILCK